ncbi:hypothetical protein [Caulobacter endophyticus]|uniref:Uncharacterized protein n=1 Tax=Caulobacter endophyticus TaxID=2172652 RepID=A0A2T9KD55_9CAUL|nr:hypothetical protein [Caulobacter endophyticus]PVM93908.1 hypothetical protein DDF67_01255 [Caulobacter endophyticus]
MSERNAYLTQQGIAAALTTLPALLLLAIGLPPADPDEYDGDFMPGLARFLFGFFAAPAAAFLLNLFTRRDSRRGLRLAADVTGWTAVLAGALALLAGAWLALISLANGQPTDGPVLGWAFFLAYFGGIILCAVHGMRERPASRKAERLARRRPPLSLSDPQNP